MKNNTVKFCNWAIENGHANIIIPVQLMKIFGDYLDYTARETNAQSVDKPIFDFEKIIKKCIEDSFDNGMHNYEKKELLSALEVIKRLMPPSYFY